MENKGAGSEMILPFLHIGGSGIWDKSVLLFIIPPKIWPWD
jgi:hypothetical protein